LDIENKIQTDFSLCAPEGGAAAFMAGANRKFDIRAKSLKDDDAKLKGLRRSPPCQPVAGDDPIGSTELSLAV
jgi:hypothetical protein